MLAALVRHPGRPAEFYRGVASTSRQGSGGDGGRESARGRVSWRGMRGWRSSIPTTSTRPLGEKRVSAAARPWLERHPRALRSHPRRVHRLSACEGAEGRSKAWNRRLLVPRRRSTSGRAGGDTHSTADRAVRGREDVVPGLLGFGRTGNCVAAEQSMLEQMVLGDAAAIASSAGWSSSIRRAQVCVVEASMGWSPRSAASPDRYSEINPWLAKL